MSRQPVSASHRRLRADKPLGLRADACVAINFSYVRCRACERACPAGALAVGADSMRLADACSGCGRCAAACGAGALRIDGMEVPAGISPAARLVQVDCRRVPHEESPAHCVRVPCLDGMAVSQWLQLVAAADGRPVLALDRGWCASCRSGGRTGLASSLDEARTLLQEIGMPSSALPARRARPLSPELAIDDFTPAGPRVSRRGFFGRLANAGASLASAVQEEPAPARTALRPGRLAQPERERRVAFLERLAARHGFALRGRLFPRVAASDRCRDHQVCAAVCPTGALHVYEERTARGIAFNAAACLACGACADACVEGALHLEPQPPGDVPKAARLTFFRVAECAGCGAPATGDEGLCPDCITSRELEADARECLFGGAAASPPSAAA